MTDLLSPKHFSSDASRLQILGQISKISQQLQSYKSALHQRDIAITAMKGQIEAKDQLIIDLRSDLAELREMQACGREAVTLRDLHARVGKELHELITAYTPPVPVDAVLDGIAPTEPAHENTCAVEWCRAPIQSRGYCGKHYHRLRAWGDPTLYKKVRGRGAASCNVMCRETGPRTMEEVPA